jgi:cytidylate kinase
MEHRINRVMSKHPDWSREKVEKTIENVDKTRENYVKKYCRVSRYDTRNYDLVITMDDKTEEEAVNVILAYIG